MINLRLRVPNAGSHVLAAEEMDTLASLQQRIQQLTQIPVALQQRW